MIIDELKKQGKALLDARRDNFVRQSLLSDEFLNFMQQNKKPFDLLMSYYECAIMEIETKFRVLNHELSLEYDNNPIESIKTRVKSYDSILKKIRRKNIPLNLQAIEENLKDIAGVRVICSFPDDIYKLAESFLKQDDITLIERKDYIKNPKPSGYRSLHLIVQVPIFLQNEKKMVNVEVQFRTIAMDFWASLDHKMRYKKELSDEEVELHPTHPISIHTLSTTAMIFFKCFIMLSFLFCYSECFMLCVSSYIYIFIIHPLNL